MRRLLVATAAALAVSCGVPEDGALAGADSELRKKCRDPAGCCGDGIVHPGEACDTGGVDTATCNGGTCLPPHCGDAYVNAAAGEQCDAGGDSVDCNANCTPVVCGDAFVNTAAGEQCDTGLDAVAGCAQCRLACSP